MTKARIKHYGKDKNIFGDHKLESFNLAKKQSEKSIKLRTRILKTLPKRDDKEFPIIRNIKNAKVIVYSDPSVISKNEILKTLNTRKDAEEGILADAWRSKTKHRVVIASANLFGTADGTQLKSPVEIKVAALCAQNFMGSSKQDVADFLQADNNGLYALSKEALYREYCELLFKQWLHAIDDSGAEDVIYPPVGLGVYLKLCNPDAKARIKEIWFSVIAHVLGNTQYKNIKRVHLTFPCDDKKNLDAPNESKDNQQLSDKIAKTNLKGPDIYVVDCDALALATELVAKGYKNILLVDPGSDRTVGGAHDDVTKTTAEEVFCNYSDVLRCMTLEYRRKIGLVDNQIEYKEFPEALQRKNNNLIQPLFESIKIAGHQANPIQDKVELIKEFSGITEFNYEIDPKTKQIIFIFANKPNVENFVSYLFDNGIRDLSKPHLPKNLVEQKGISYITVTEKELLALTPSPVHRAHNIVSTSAVSNDQEIKAAIVEDKRELDLSNPPRNLHELGMQFKTKLSRIIGKPIAELTVVFKQGKAIVTFTPQEILNQFQDALYHNYYVQEIDTAYQFDGNNLTVAINIFLQHISYILDIKIPDPETFEQAAMQTNAVPSAPTIGAATLAGMATNSSPSVVPSAPTMGSETLKQLDKLPIFQRKTTELRYFVIARDLIEEALISNPDKSLLFSKCQLLLNIGLTAYQQGYIKAEYSTEACINFINNTGQPERFLILEANNSEFCQIDDLLKISIPENEEQNIILQKKIVYKPIVNPLGRPSGVVVSPSKDASSRFNYQEYETTMMAAQAEYQHNAKQNDKTYLTDSLMKKSDITISSTLNGKKRLYPLLPSAPDKSAPPKVLRTKKVELTKDQTEIRDKLKRMVRLYGLDSSSVITTQNGISVHDPKVLLILNNTLGIWTKLGENIQWNIIVSKGINQIEFLDHCIVKQNEFTQFKLNSDQNKLINYFLQLGMKSHEIIVSEVGFVIDNAAIRRFLLDKKQITEDINRVYQWNEAEKIISDLQKVNFLVQTPENIQLIAGDQVRLDLTKDIHPFKKQIVLQLNRLGIIPEITGLNDKDEIRIPNADVFLFLVGAGLINDKQITYADANQTIPLGIRWGSTHEPLGLGIDSYQLKTFVDSFGENKGLFYTAPAKNKDMWRQPKLFLQTAIAQMISDLGAKPEEIVISKGWIWIRNQQILHFLANHSVIQSVHSNYFDVSSFDLERLETIIASEVANAKDTLKIIYDQIEILTKKVNNIIGSENVLLKKDPQKAEALQTVIDRITLILPNNTPCLIQDDEKTIMHKIYNILQESISSPLLRTNRGFLSSKTGETAEEYTDSQKLLQDFMNAIEAKFKIIKKPSIPITSEEVTSNIPVHYINLVG